MSASNRRTKGASARATENTRDFNETSSSPFTPHHQVQQPSNGFTNNSPHSSGSSQSFHQHESQAFEKSLNDYGQAQARTPDANRGWGSLGSWINTAVSTVSEVIENPNAVVSKAQTISRYLSTGITQEPTFANADAYIYAFPAVFSRSGYP